MAMYQKFAAEEVALMRNRRKERKETKQATIIITLRQTTESTKGPIQWPRHSSSGRFPIS